MVHFRESESKPIESELKNQNQKLRIGIKTVESESKPETAVVQNLNITFSLLIRSFHHNVSVRDIGSFRKLLCCKLALEHNSTTKTKYTP